MFLINQLFNLQSMKVFKLVGKTIKQQKKQETFRLVRQAKVEATMQP